MPDFDFDLRSKILTLRPGLGLAKANELIQDIARCYVDVLKEEAQTDPETGWQDFFTFVCADWLFLSAVFRETEVTFSLFESDHTFIQESERLSSVEADAFGELVEEKATGTITSLTFAMEQARPWLEKRAV